MEFTAKFNTPCILLSSSAIELDFEPTYRGGRVQIQTWPEANNIVTSVVSHSVSNTGPEISQIPEPSCIEILNIMGDYAMTHNNITRDEDGASLEPSVWSLVKDHLDMMITQAFRRTQVDKLYSDKVAESLRNFTMRLEQLLEGPLKDVTPGHNVGKTIHQKVEAAVKGAVDEAMNEQNETNALTSNLSLVSLKDKLVVTLESKIELDVFNKVLTNHTGFQQEEDKNSSLLHNLHIKDETMFVVLVSMAIIIPGIFISLLIFFFYRRQNDAKERRQEMLLQDQPEFSMDEYNMEDRQPSLKIEIPDLDLHNLKI